MAREVLEQLVKNGKVIRGHLGIVVQPVTKDIAASLDLNEAGGVIVSQIQPDSAAERVGLIRGDVILALNGNAVSDTNSFRNDIARTPPGRTVTLRIWRGGNEQELRPTLGEFAPEQRPARVASPESGAVDGGKLGLAVQPLTSAVARQLGINPNTEGLVVVEVVPFGPGAEAGIRQGDVIEEANQQPVRSVNDLRAAIDRAGKDPLLLLVNHRGTTIFVTIRLL
jgi:S1-C subfamily serine protease